MRLSGRSRLCAIVITALSAASVLGLIPAVAEPPPAASSGGDSVTVKSVRLLVRIEGLRSNDGHVRVALFHGRDGFPNRDEKAAGRTVVAITDKRAETAFDGLVPGDYAVSLFHDENDNGRLDTSLGFPREGFGVSNDPRPRLGPPRWDAARFAVTADRPAQTITIHVRYLSSHS